MVLRLALRVQIEIKKFLEGVYGLQVDKVNTCNVEGRKRRGKQGFFRWEQGWGGCPPGTCWPARIEARDRMRRARGPITSLLPQEIFGAVEVAKESASATAAQGGRVLACCAKLCT